MMFKCGYVVIQCPNYGCDKEMFRKDYIETCEKSCEFRETYCEKCGFKNERDPETNKEIKCNDCVTKTQKKFHDFETAVLKLRKQVTELEEQMTKVSGQDAKYVRHPFNLPEFQMIQFSPKNGWN